MNATGFSKMMHLDLFTPLCNCISLTWSYTIQVTLLYYWLRICKSLPDDQLATVKATSANLLCTALDIADREVTNWAYSLIEVSDEWEEREREIDIEIITMVGEYLKFVRRV